MATKQWYIINSKSGLVLEDFNGDVITQHLTKYPQQRWVMEPAGHNMFYFKNCATGRVMEVESGRAITKPKTGDLPQRWLFNDDRTITTCINGHALDICEEKYVPFSKILVYPKHGRANQRFHMAT